MVQHIQINIVTIMYVFTFLDRNLESQVCSSSAKKYCNC